MSSLSSRDVDPDAQFLTWQLATTDQLTAWARSLAGVPASQVGLPHPVEHGLSFSLGSVVGDMPVTVVLRPWFGWRRQFEDAELTLLVRLFGPLSYDAFMRAPLEHNVPVLGEALDFAVEQLRDLLVTPDLTLRSLWAYAQMFTLTELPLSSATLLASERCADPLPPFTLTTG